MAIASNISLVLILSALVSTSLSADIPEQWTARAETGALVWSRLPVEGPMPNFGNGFLAAEFPSDSVSAQMYIAGVFTGGLPPPFGNATGGVSQRAPVPLPLTQLPNGTGWKGTALANDFEQATIEVLHQHEAEALDTASVTIRHFFHREEMHLLVSEVLVNNSAGTEALDVEMITPWQANDSGAGGIAFRESPLPAGDDGLRCQVGTTTEAERVLSGQNAGTGMERVTVAVCYPSTLRSLRAGPGAVANDSTVVTVYTSRESDDPLKDAIAAWQHYTAAGVESLHVSHSRAQTRLWSSRIEVSGNLELAKAVNSSLYGILISVREELNYSTSPGRSYHRGG